MATLTFVKRGDFPETIKGKVGTSQVTVTNNGQIVVSTLATKSLGDTEHVGMAFAGMKVCLFIETAKAVAKLEKKHLIKLNKSKKSKTVSFAASKYLDAMGDIGADGKYDFRASGNQSFPATWDEKLQALIFELPKGALKPKPVVSRKKQVPPTAPPPTAPKVASAGAGATTTESEEIEELEELLEA